MKKLVLLFAAATLAVSVNAQTVTESKTFDNFYIGINGGVATKTTGHSWMSDLDPNAGIRIGRYFTPVFGLAVESNAYFSNKPWKSTGTAVRGLNTSLLATVNLSNWFGGYKGEPRLFEISAVYGLGWGHLFTASATKSNVTELNNATYEPSNRMTSKVGLDFQFNFGSVKQFQFYIEPSINYAFLGRSHGSSWDKNEVGIYGYKATANNDQPAYNIQNSAVQLNAGLIYKFKNSNGTHNFTIVVPRDQAEIDALNAQINDLRNELAKKPKEVVKEVVKEAPAKEVRVENMVLITFAQGKSNLTSDAKKSLDGINSNAHVQIIGTASPEGSKKFNQKLSQKRADVVAKYLKNRGVNVDSAEGKGVQGNTSNRLAIVYVK